MNFLLWHFSWTTSFFANYSSSIKLHMHKKHVFGDILLNELHIMQRKIANPSQKNLIHVRNNWLFPISSFVHFLIFLSCKRNEIHLVDSFYVAFNTSRVIEMRYKKNFYDIWSGLNSEFFFVVPSSRRLGAACD